MLLPSSFSWGASLAIGLDAMLLGGRGEVQQRQFRPTYPASQSVSGDRLAADGEAMMAARADEARGGGEAGEGAFAPHFAIGENVDVAAARGIAHIVEAMGGAGCAEDHPHIGGLDAVALKFGEAIGRGVGGGAAFRRVNAAHIVRRHGELVLASARMGGGG